MKILTFIFIGIMVGIPIGYILSSNSLKGEIDNTKIVSETIKMNFHKFDSKIQLLEVSRHLKSDYDTLNKLISITKTGKPIEIAISESRESLLKSTNYTSEKLNEINNEKLMKELSNLINRSESLLKDAEFYINK